MTMHLVRGMTTTNTRKRKQKNKSKSLLEAEAQHAKFLERMGVGKTKTVVKTKRVETKQVDNSIPLSNNIAGIAPKRKVNVYSGERKLLGIATMHKSNMVPVFEQKDAEDIARMRRG